MGDVTHNSVCHTPKMHNAIFPPKFVDGSLIYDQFLMEYEKHQKGLFILAPSGSGKTYFVKNQKEKHWIDGDKLWVATGAHPLVKWWTMGLEVMDAVDQRSDIVTAYAKKLGLWIIGASQNWLIPDAIYIPDWETHKQFILQRENNNYDGGATSADYHQVLGHIEYMKRLAKDHNVPFFQQFRRQYQL